MPFSTGFFALIWRKRLAETEPIALADPRIFDRVHEVADKVNAEPTHAALPQAAGEVGRWRAQRIERTPRVIDVDDDLAAYDLQANADLAARARLKA